MNAQQIIKEHNEGLRPIAVADVKAMFPVFDSRDWAHYAAIAGLPPRARKITALEALKLWAIAGSGGRVQAHQVLPFLSDLGNRRPKEIAKVLGQLMTRPGARITGYDRISKSLKQQMPASAHKKIRHRAQVYRAFERAGIKLNRHMTYGHEDIHKVASALSS